MQSDQLHEEVLPGVGLDMAKMPGHWVLAQMGKRVLRPGGLELTRQMLGALAVQSTDTVVEFAPGLGVTTRLVLAQQPESYIGVERSGVATQHIRQILSDPRYRCVVGQAESTGLEDQSATVVYGEAMLTMQTAAHKKRIVDEAWRLLRPGGRYGIHELCLTPDTIDTTRKDEILQGLSDVIRVGARPLTVSEWTSILEESGFVVNTHAMAPMHLLQPQRIIQDEGLGRSLRIMYNVWRHPVARKRVLAMRRVFHQYRDYLAAVMMVATKRQVSI